MLKNVRDQRIFPDLCHPERSDGSGSAKAKHPHNQIPRFTRNDTQIKLANSQILLLRGCHTLIHNFRLS